MISRSSVRQQIMKPNKKSKKTVVRKVKPNKKRRS